LEQLTASSKCIIPFYILSIILAPFETLCGLSPARLVLLVIGGLAESNQIKSIIQSINLFVWTLMLYAFQSGSGMGKSFQRVPGVKAAEVRENTLLSFTNSGLAGAAFVELDVQLTRDRVPVSCAPTRYPTAKQMLHVNLCFSITAFSPFFYYYLLLRR
jgi:hypothetical protein